MIIRAYFDLSAFYTHIRHFFYVFLTLSGYILIFLFSLPSLPGFKLLHHCSKSFSNFICKTASHAHSRKVPRRPRNLQVEAARVGVHVDDLSGEVQPFLDSIVEGSTSLTLTPPCVIIASLNPLSPVSVNSRFLIVPMSLIRSSRLIS